MTKISDQWIFLLKRLIQMATSLLLCLSAHNALAQPQQGTASFSGYPMDNIPWDQRSSEDKVFNSSYEDRNTFKHQQIHDVDPFQWVVTQDFADKFRMPRQWIDPNLKGALALAWRMTTMGKNTCGYGRNPQSCWPRLTCQLDIYFDSKTPLPWNYTDVVRDNMIEGITSDSYLPRLQSNSKWWRYVDSIPKTSKGPVLPNGRLQMRYVKGGALDSGGLRLWLFDMEYEPGVVMLGYQGACPVFDGDGPGVINYYTQSELTRTRGVNPQSVHAVEIPETFVKKIRAIYLEQNKPNREVTQRLYEDFLRSREPVSPSVAPSK